MAAPREYSFAAVLTGDFIASRRRMAALDRSMAVIAETARDIAADTGMHCVFQRFRGDGWQVFLSDGEIGMDAALRVIAALTAADALQTRLALGFGSACLSDDNDLASAHGAAFTTSGDLLDAMDKADHLAAPRFETPDATAYAALVMFLDAESRSWTRGQAEAVFEALRRAEPTQEEIARKIGITRQAVQSRLSGTALPAVLHALHAFRSRLRDICTDPDTETGRPAQAMPAAGGRGR